MPCLFFATTVFPLIITWAKTEETVLTHVGKKKNYNLDLEEWRIFQSLIPLEAGENWPWKPPDPGQMSEPIIPCQQGLGWVVAVGLSAPESHLTQPHSDSHLCTLAYRSCSPVRGVKYSWRCSHCYLRMSKLEETPGRKSLSPTEALTLHTLKHSSLISGEWIGASVCFQDKFTDSI